MEAVELAIPAAVVVPKLMGSDSLIEARVTLTDTEAGESDFVPTFVSPKAEKCGSVVIHRDLPGHVNTSETSPCMHKAEMESCWNSSQVLRLLKEDMPKELNHGGISSPVMLVSGCEEKQLPRSGGKVPRNGNGCLKRSRMPPVENLMVQDEIDDAKACSKPGSLVKCLSGEKSQTARTKNSLYSKRVDRRISKVPLKAKSELFSLKAGLAGFNPAPGGSSTFGMYGLKSEVHDITKLMHDISLNELLDGSYKCPTLGKDRGKKAASANENFLDSVRKAFSILQFRASVRTKQSEGVDIDLNKKAPMIPSSSSLCMPSMDGDEGNSELDSPSSNKEQESCPVVKAPVDSSNPPSIQPGDILERLSPPRDLESLLQDAAKPAASSRCTDLRSSRPTSHLISLPPLPSSHNYTGHCKSNSDTAKLANRNTCHGRWVRILNTHSFLGGSGGSFINLDALSYDNSLVPASGIKYAFPISASASTLVNVTQFDQPSSSATCPAASQSIPEAGSNVECKMNGPYSPRLLAAAQTLYDIANKSPKNDPNGITKWPKQPSQKVMKARKFKSTDKPEDLSRRKSEIIVNDTVRSDHAIPLKKPKLSTTGKKEDLRNVNAARPPNCWFAPRSSRSSPIRSPRDSSVEGKYLNSNFPKQPFMGPPPARFLDKAGHSQQKPRKTVPMDWSRTKS